MNRGRAHGTNADGTYQMGKALAERAGGNDVYPQQCIETAKYTNEKTMNYRQYLYYTRYVAV